MNSNTFNTYLILKPNIDRQYQVLALRHAHMSLARTISDRIKILTMMKRNVSGCQPCKIEETRHQIDSLTAALLLKMVEVGIVHLPTVDGPFLCKYFRR